MLNQYDRKRIKEMDLCKFLSEVHPNDVTDHGNWVRLNCDPSVNIRKGKSLWQNFSRVTDQQYGDGIALLTNFLSYDFKSACDELIDYLKGVTVEPKEESSNKSDTKPENEYCMPTKSPGYPRTVYAYLGKTRHIPYQIIDYLLDTGYIYQTDKFFKDTIIHNVVFTTPANKFYEIRGCNTKGKVFHQSNSLTLTDCFTLATDKEPEEIFITESSIDAISLYSLHCIGREIHKAIYVGLGGIAKIQPMEHLIKKYPNAKPIIAVDNDPAGDDMRLAYKDYSNIIPKNKDWNEDLCEVFSNEKEK